MSCDDYLTQVVCLTNYPDWALQGHAHTNDSIYCLYQSIAIQLSSNVYTVHFIVCQIRQRHHDIRSCSSCWSYDIFPRKRSHLLIFSDSHDLTCV